MAAREHSRSGRVHPDATAMPSRRALLGAALALPLACAASPRRQEFTALSPPDARPPGPLPLPDAHPPNTPQSFAVTRSDRAPSLPDHPEPGRRGEDDDSGDAQHAESNEAHALAVTKWDRALARFRRAERIVKAAEGEPDEDRYDILLGRFNDTLRHLLRTPAPHLPALAAKLAAANRHAAWELTGAETCIAVLARDARRLASLPSRSS